MLSKKHDNLTFGGHPIYSEEIDGVIYIEVKGVKGTLTEIESFINAKDRLIRYFGDSKIRNWEKGQIRIDCLTEEKKIVKKLIQNIKEYYNA